MPGGIGVAEVVNFVPSEGGRDAETQDEAEFRARKLLTSRDRAVTADDFKWIASQAKGVNVARVEVVPLRRPLPGGVAVAPSGGTPSPVPAGLAAPRCAPPVPAGPMGLSRTVVPGAVTVIVVPKAAGSWAWGVAATIAAVAVVGWTATSLTQTPGTALAKAREASSVTAAQVRTIALPQDYVLVHQEYSPSTAIQGVGPYIRSVSAPGVDVRR